ncbi:MAG: leucine-rich repeat protein, partial [Clostridium sp.]
PAPSDKSVIAPGETKAPAAAKAPETAGTKIASKKGDTYKVTDTSGKIPEVELTKSAAKKKAKTVVIPKTVKVDGVNYKVTAIAEKAFAGNKKLKTVVIGADIEKIGAKAFYKCVNLKKVTIQTTKLKAKTVGAKAFAKIHKKAVVKVPKAKKKAYKKWLKKRGIGGKQKIVTNV